MTYLPYAGIGARNTPQIILEVMRHLSAHLASIGFVLRSGGANGADTAFEVGVEDFEASQFFNGEQQKVRRREIYLPWAGFNNNPSTLHPGNLPFSKEEIDFAARLHPNWAACRPSVQRLHASSVRQLIGHHSLCGESVELSRFLVCWTENGAIRGGTGQTIRMAQNLGVPVFNLGGPRNNTELERLVQEISDFALKLKPKA